MKTKRRTKITVETHRLLVIRARPPLDEGWCERCGKRAARISVQDATEAGVSSEAITRLAEENRLHLATDAEGVSFICLNSLVE